jgi:hypothetical protein
MALGEPTPTLVYKVSSMLFCTSFENIGKLFFNDLVCEQYTNVCKLHANWNEKLFESNKLIIKKLIL